MTRETNSSRAVWLAIGLLAGLTAAGVTGMIFYVGGAQLLTGAVAVAGAFGGTVTLFMTAYRFLAETSVAGR